MPLLLKVFVKDRKALAEKTEGEPLDVIKAVFESTAEGELEPV
jgi:hypothetical protein